MALRFIFPLLVFLSLLSAPQAVFSGEAQPQKSEFLTLEERIWLDAHPIIRLAPDPDCAPIEGIDEKHDIAPVATDPTGRRRRRTKRFAPGRQRSACGETEQALAHRRQTRQPVPQI